VRHIEKPKPEYAGRLTLTSEGVAWLGVALLLGLVGWLKSINLVLILAYMMFALLCLNGWLARLQARGVAAARTRNPPAFAGETAAVRLTATNSGRRTATVNVEERFGPDAISWFIHRLPASQTVLCTGTRAFPRRGRFASSLWVSSGFPLGLLRCDRTAETVGEFIVLPALGAVDAPALRHWLSRQAGGDGRARKVLRRLTTDQADVRGVRPYRSGDPLRSIHWRSTARRGELMVREYDVAPSPELILVVEPWLPPEPTRGDHANLEDALSLATTIAWSWSREFDARVTIVIAGDADSARTAGSTDAALRETLAPLASVVGSSKFDALEPRAFHRSLQRAARLVVSSRRDAPYAAALARSTGRPFLTVSPLNRPSWYMPPPHLASAEDR
jgi:uncharacterized protein (DUF58 family)